MATPYTSNTVKENEHDGPIPPENEHAGAKLAKSVNQLNDLSIAIQAFKNRYDELQKHLEFIEQAIDTRTKELKALGPTAAAQATTGNGDIVRSEPEPEPEPESKSKAEGVGGGEGEENELVSLCKTMNSRGLRKYIVSHLSETTSLREQVPLALKSAPKPSRLVFECIGRFFLQGSKAYTKDSPMIPARQGSILVLEYYLTSGCVESEAQMEPPLKEEALSAAVSWRKRLIFEGGVSRACEIDARGLVFFIACFGIPSIFKNEDIWNLVRLSNPREISNALRQSQVLLRRVPDVAEEMMKKGMVVGAIDLAYTFGFEEKFSSQTVLTSFLQKSKDAWNKAKQEARDIPSLLKEANVKYLTALKSVVNCLEGHKVDFVQLLPEWQLKDTILILEKDIGDITKKIVAKRKDIKSNTSNKVKIPEAKRTRFSVKDPSVASPSVTTLQEQRIASHMDGNSSYDGSLAAHLLRGRSYCYPNNYPTAASSMQIASVSGSSLEGFLGSAVAGGGSMYGGAIAGPAMSAGIGNPADSFSGYQGGMMTDNVGTTLNSNSYLYRWHGIGEGALSYDRSVGQSFVGQPSSARVNHLYGKTSTEGFTGLADHHGVASRSGGSDLYSFADAVFDT